MALLSNIKAILTLDTKQYSQGLKKSQKETKEFGASFKGAGLLKGGAVTAGLGAVALAVGKIGNEMATTYWQIKNAEKAFKRFGDQRFLRQLRFSTGRMVDDLHLMQQAIQATNLGLRRSDLPTFFKFATIRAAETGVAVDYLVNSIVTGVGRESRLVLDNLGISLKELNAEIQRIGKGFTAGAVSLINKKFKESGRTVNEVTSGVVQLQTALENLYQVAAGEESGFGDMWDRLSGWLANQLNTITGEGRVMGMGDISQWTDQMIQNTIDGFKRSGLDWTEELAALYYELHTRAIERASTMGPFEFNLQALIPYYKQQVEDLKKLMELSYDSREIEEFRKQLEVAQGRLDYLMKGDPIDPENAPVPDFIKYTTDMLEEEEAQLAKTTEAWEKYNEAMRESFDFDEEYIDDLDNLTSAMEEAARRGQELASMIEGTISNAIISLGTAIGRSLGGDTSAFSNFVQELAGIMQQFGALLIAWGIAELALFESLAAGPYGAVIAIAAGAALVGIGAALSASQGDVGSAAGYSGATSLGSVSSGSYSTGSTYDYNREIVFVARGDDLVAVLNRHDYRTNTNG